jgi:nicotinate phosphoribosyltransferase
MIVYSDGLDVVKMLDLYTSYHDRIKTTFGWGTGLTNDIMIAPISIVVKVVNAGGCPTVKLSDNLSKALGPREDVMERRRYFGYMNTYNEPCRV